MIWGERLMTFPEVGGLGQSGLHNLLELELLNRANVPNGSWGPWGVRPTGLAAILGRTSDRASCTLRRERARRSGWGRGVRPRTSAQAG